MKKTVITISCVGCAILLCVIAAVITNIRKRIPENPETYVGNTAGNFYNKGLFCENGGYVYFANAYDGFALYSMRADETEIRRLIPTEVQSINADGRYLYYYQAGSGKSSGFGSIVSTTGVFRAGKKNAENSACLDKVLGNYVLLAGNNVYYTSAGEEMALRKVSTNGKNKEKLLELDILPVSIQDAKFYYMNNTGDLHLMALDLKTNSSRQVLGEDVYMPIIEGTTIYCIDIHDNYALIAMNVTDGTKTVLDSSKTDILNVTDKYIYYQTSGDSPQLKRVRRDGSGMEVVADGTYTNINATSQYIYFTKFGSDTPVYKTPANGSVIISTFDAASKAALNENSGK